MARNLAAILDDMHAALLAGDFARLNALVPDLEDARAQVVAHGHPDPTALRDKARRNALCLQAAVYGVKSARRRIADIAEAARGLTTYDRVGSKATLNLTEPKPRRV
jgi:hypothetical protein